MAKIAFFTESLPPRDDLISDFAYDLVCNLADQQHEITIFSTFRNGDLLPSSRPRIEILRPFKKWSWLELPRLIPILTQLRPDVLHIIQPRAEALEGLTNAMNAIPGFAPLIGRPALVSSFYDLRKETLKAQRFLLHSSDAVTVTNRSQLEILQNYFLQKSPLIELLPVPGFRAPEDDFGKGAEIESEPEPEFVSSFLSRSHPNNKLIFVPGEIDEHGDLDALFSNLATALTEFPEALLIFGGGWGKIPPKRRHSLMRAFSTPELGGRVLISGYLKPATERMILNNAEVVFVASLPNESLRLSRILREALVLASVLVMGDEQAKLDSLSWQNQEHAFIANSVTSHPQNWFKALREALSNEAIVTKIRQNLPEFARLEVLDRPGNVMSRIYTQILGQKRFAHHPRAF